MHNSGGRPTYNMNYDNSDLRMPISLLADPHHRGPPRLSAEAKEFVPSFRVPLQMASNVGPVTHHSYQQQQHHLIHLQQQPQFHSPQHLNQHPHHQQQQAFHLQQQHPLHQAIQMQNHHPNQRRGGGRHSVQDRLIINGGDPQHLLQHHPQHHHQQQQQQLHHHHQHQQQHVPQHLQQQLPAVVAAANHQQIPRHQMHHVQNLERQQHHQQHHNNHHHHQHQNNVRRNHNGNNHHAAAAAAAAAAASAGALANGGGAGHGAGEESMSEAQVAALDFLTETINILNDDPGKFEQSQKELNALYIEFAQDNYVISNSIEILFDHSITEQNFRYMGARICRLLDAIDATPDSLFRTLLKMKMDFNQQENQHFMTNEAHKVRGTTMFLAELFLQLQNDGSRMEDVATSICQSIDLLLQKTTPENLKSVCMALKLCGYDLEQDCPVDVGKFIAALRRQNDIDVSTQRMIDSVLENASNRWGRNDSISMAAPIEHNQHQQEFSNEPVYYGPDGKIITEEESSFLSSIFAAANEPSFNGSDKEENSDPEMDDEIKAAYQDFLKDMSN